MISFLLDLLSKQGFLFSRLYVDACLLTLLVLLIQSYAVPLLVHYRKCLDLTRRGCSSPRHWFFGHNKFFPNTARGMRRRIDAMVRHKGMFITWFGPLKVFADAHRPTTLATLFYSNAPKDELVYGFLRPWLGDGLLIASGAKWHRNRKLLTPAFHFEVLKQYTAINNQCAKVLVGKWRSRTKEAFCDVSDDVGRMTMDVTLQCTMSARTNCQLDWNNRYVNAVHQLLEIVIERVHSPLLMIDWIFWLSSPGRRFRKACEYVHRFDERMIRERKEKLDRELATLGTAHGKTQEEVGLTFKKKHLDFIDILLRSKDENGKGLSIKEIRDEVDTFLFEGHDTTASGISWLIYNLARHPHYQQKCREEVMKIIGSREEVEWDDLHQLTYLGMCIKESLRLNPAVLTIARKFNKKTTFVDKYTPGGKLEVEAGTSSFVHVYVVHRSELNWENPFQYDPERFSTENVAKRDPLTFVAFSAGPRNCIGKTFAMNEIKVTLCHILRNFKLSVDADTPETIEKPNIVLRSESGINIKLRDLDSGE